MTKRIRVIGLSGALAVALGALCAHALKEQMNKGHISIDAFNGFETAVRYHLFHTLVLLVLVVWQKDNWSKSLNRAYLFFFWGTVLFSGSLYLLCTRELWNAEWLKVLGPVTPVGGILMITGWVTMAFGTFKKP